MRDRIRLAIIVPCYNEEPVLKDTNYRLLNLLGEMLQEKSIKTDSYILYVDDGSKDKTWSMIQEFHKRSEMVYGVKLSRNRGHQNAVLAGLNTALDNCDAAISIDADLQDDIQSIKEMVEKYRNGDEIVLGVRNNRDTDSVLKRGTAEMFYKIMKHLGTDTVKDHADFRLLSNRALQELKNYKEINLYLRGIVLELGFKTGIVYYKREARKAGKTHYSISKMFGLALSGITSFSIKPIRLVFFLGLFLTGIGFLAGIAIAVLAILNMGITWIHAIFVSLWFICGLILLSVGIIGEYVGRDYMETKQRPRYIIEEKLMH